MFGAKTAYLSTALDGSNSYQVLGMMYRRKQNWDYLNHDTLFMILYTIAYSVLGAYK